MEEIASPDKGAIPRPRRRHAQAPRDQLVPVWDGRRFLHHQQFIKTRFGSCTFSSREVVRVVLRHRRGDSDFQNSMWRSCASCSRNCDTDPAVIRSVASSGDSGRGRCHTSASAVPGQHDHPLASLDAASTCPGVRHRRSAGGCSCAGRWGTFGLMVRLMTLPDLAADRHRSPLRRGSSRTTWWMGSTATWSLAF